MSVHTVPRPDSTAHIDSREMTPLRFKKQPVPAATGSDSEFISSSDGHDQPRPLSLLTSMLSSPRSDDSRPRTECQVAVSASSSPPSTAFSSPRVKEEPISILRRGSISDGEAFFLPSAQVIASPSPPREGRLLASPPRPALKFAVAACRSEREPRILADMATNEDVLDPGYEEDSEDGMSDDDEDVENNEDGTYTVQSRSVALNRALSLLDNRSRSPPPAPIFDYPNRSSAVPTDNRGRGHVRVDPSAVQNNNSCSRHCSPPPAEPKPFRAALPGPREGRAGSPVPSQEVLSDLNAEEEDEDDENQSEDGPYERRPPGEGGEGPRDQSALLSSDSSDEEPTRGLRQMLRRASEHIPAFRRRSFGWTVGDTALARPSEAGDSVYPEGKVLRARSMSTGPLRTGVASFSGASEVRSPPLPCPGRSSTKASDQFRL